MSEKKFQINIQGDVDSGDVKALADQLSGVADRFKQELTDKQLNDKNPKLTGIQVTVSFTADVPDTLPPASATPLEIKGVRSVKVHTLTISTL